jgi:hypothetical protein
VIWLDVKQLRPGVTPAKPGLSDYNTSYKLETNVSETSNFVAVKKKVEEFVTLFGTVHHCGLTALQFTRA